MDPQSKAALVKCTFDIKKNITSTDEVMDKLLQKNCLTWEERSRIGGEKSIDSQCQSILEILIRRGGGSFDSFLNVLTETGNTSLVDTIENAVDEVYAAQKKKETQPESTVKKENANNNDSYDDTLLIENNKVTLANMALEDELKSTKDELEKIRGFHARALKMISRTEKDNSQKDDKIKQLKRECEEMKKEIERLKKKEDYLAKEIVLKDAALQRAEEEKRETANAIKRLEKQQEETRETCGEILGQLAALSKASQNEQKINREILNALSKNQQSKHSRQFPNNTSKYSKMVINTMAKK